MKASIHLLAAALLFTVACGDSSTDANLLGDNPNNETVTTVQCDTQTKDVNQYTQVRCYPRGTDPVADGYCALSTWETPCELFAELPPSGIVGCDYLTRLADKAHSNADVCEKVLGEPWRSADRGQGRVQLTLIHLFEHLSEGDTHYDIQFFLRNMLQWNASNLQDLESFCYSISVTGADDPNPRYEQLYEKDGCTPF